MRTICILFIACVIGFSLKAQPESKGRIIAEDLFTKNCFAVAWPYYLKLVAADSNDPSLNYKLGICYMNSRSQKFKAVSYFQKAAAAVNADKTKVDDHANRPDRSNNSFSKETEVPLITYKLLADAYYHTYKFDEAIATYEKFKNVCLGSKNYDPSIINEVNWKIELCKTGKELNELKELVASLVNHKFGDADTSFSSSGISSPVVSIDGSIVSYTFHRPDSTEVKWNDDREYFEDIFISENKISSKPLNVLKDTERVMYETNVATSINGQIILIYKDDDGNGNLYVSNLLGNHWSEPEKLNKTSNHNGWEPNEFISADGLELYFTSDRKEGYGGRDIYKCNKLPNGEWGKAINLGPNVNSPYDEEAPFVHPDGVTLYFSSNKNRNEKTFEIFTSIKGDSGMWTTPVNVGYPAKKIKDSGEPVAMENTPAVADSKEAIIEKDNYLVTFLNQKNAGLTILKGKIIDKDAKVPRHIEITVSDNETGGISGIYHADMQNGQYLFMLPQGKNNNVTYEAEGYLFQSQNMNSFSEKEYYKIYNTVQLYAIEPGATVILNNIFFDSAAASLKPTSTVELNNILRLLQKNPGFAIEITNYINSQENLDKLSQERADAIVNYLLDKGINKERLEAKGKLEDPRRTKHKRKHKAHETVFQKVELKIVELEHIKLHKKHKKHK